MLRPEEIVKFLLFRTLSLSQFLPSFVRICNVTSMCLLFVEESFLDARKYACFGSGRLEFPEAKYFLDMWAWPVEI